MVYCTLLHTIHLIDESAKKKMLASLSTLMQYLAFKNLMFSFTF